MRCRQTQSMEEMEENQEEIREEVVEAQVQEAETAPANSVDHNWRQAQEVMSLQKREIEALRHQMNAIATAPKPEEPDEFETADPDDYVPMGKAREMAKKYAAREARQEAKKMLDEYAKTQRIEQDEVKTRSQYEDYDYVIENYSLPMIKNDPALAYQVQMSKNPAQTAYKLGRMSDKFEETTMKQTSPKADKILKNSARPVSSHSSTTSLQQQSNAYSKMSQADIWAQSQAYARRA